MEPVTLTIDSSKSKITLHTRAVGMLARLAHDLELVVTELRGQAVRDENGFSGDLTVPVASIHVSGQLHGDRVDSSGISQSERSEIEKKIRDEVFAGTKDIHIRGRGSAWNHADVTVEAAAGKMPLSMTLNSREADGQVHISGRTELSLAKLGVREIKGPLGAFKVKDIVEVTFDVTLRPAG